MATYYISTTGSDAAAGTLAAPWATLVHADSVVVAGDTVRVLPGTYTFTGTSTDFDDLDTHPNGTSGAHITWISDTPRAAKLVSSGSVGGGAYVLWRAKGNWTDIIGFEMYATSANVNMSTFLAIEGSNCTVQNCIIHDAQLGVCSSSQGGSGVYAGNSTYTNTNVSILNCKIYNIGPANCLYNHGIYHAIQGGSVNNNICYGNGGWGIHFHHNPGSINCFNNLCFNNGHGGIQVSSSGTDGHATVDNMLVANNITCYNLGGNGGISDFLGGSNNKYFNNDSYSNSTGNYIIAAGTQTNNIAVDPLFVNYQTDGSGNYHLATGSPCIDTGYPTGAPASDYDGIARPSGAGFDIGPYEFGPSMTTQPNGPTGTWTLVFADEFDDTPGMSGPLNGLAQVKWNCGWFTGPSSPGVGNTTGITDPINSSTIAYFGPAGIVFPGDGALHLRLQNGVDNGGTFNTRTKESGMITTAGLMNLNPSYAAVSTASPDLRSYTTNGATVLEFRARIPGPNASATYYWPGVMLTNAGNYGGTNPNGTQWPGGQTYLEEIDLIEWFGGGSLGSGSAFNLHAASSYAGGGIPASLLSTDLSLAYHTYTYEFTSTTITIWVDGILVTNVTPTAAQMAAQWADPQYLLINFQANTGASLPTTAASTPSDFMIDYVRVWKNTYLDYKNTIEPQLVAALTAKSLLNFVQLIGPDTTMANDSWLTSAASDLGSQLAGYVRHAFPTGATDISGGSLEVAAKSLVGSVYANDATGKPIIQAEMGDAAMGPGESVTLYQYGIEMADYAVQLARAGMAALIAYDLDDDMHVTEWGMWQITTDTGMPRPWFFPWSLLTQTLVPGSSLYAPAEPTSNDLRVLAARSPQGGWTFVLVNRRATTQNIQVVVPFAPVVSTALQVYAYSSVAALFVDSNGFPLASGTLNTILPRGFTLSLAGSSVLILTEAAATETSVFDVKRPPLQKRR